MASRRLWRVGQVGWLRTFFCSSDQNDSIAALSPAEGGVTNAYDYPNDPINKLDLTGMMTADSYLRWLQTKKYKGDEHKVWDRMTGSGNRLFGVAKKSTKAPDIFHKLADDCLCVSPQWFEPIRVRQSRPGWVTQVTWCSGFCITGGLARDDHGRYSPFWGFGLGPEGSVSASRFRVSDISSGFAISGGCSAEFGPIGGEIGLGIGDQVYLYGGGGYGVGAGCSVMATFNY